MSAITEIISKCVQTVAVAMLKFMWLSSVVLAPLLLLAGALINVISPRFLLHLPQPIVIALLIWVLASLLVFPGLVVTWLNRGWKKSEAQRIAEGRPSYMDLIRQERWEKEKQRRQDILKAVNFKRAGRTDYTVSSDVEEIATKVFDELEKKHHRN